MANTVKTVLLGIALAATCAAQSPAPTPAKAKNPAYRAIVQDAQSHVKRLDIQQFREWRDARRDYLLIDVREGEEWAKGHAAGAIHIGKGVLERDIEAAVPDKGASIVLYCHSGARSALAAENLARMGYSQVYSLDGGLTAYEAAGLAVGK
jgi:rhodanese-related sulfurtransferase